MAQIINERLTFCKHSFNFGLIKSKTVKNQELQRTFADRLRAAMAQAGISRPMDLARKTGASPQLINKWLKGVTQNIRAADLFRLSDALQVSGRWLLFGEGSVGKYTQLSLEERELLMIFNALPSDWREDWVSAGRNTMTRLAIKPSINEPFPDAPTHPINKKD
jgi:transcriptional regulator with XRE-family HTH domain